MNKNLGLSKNTTIIIVLIVLVAGGIGGYFYQKQKNEDKTTVVSTDDATSNTTVDMGTTDPTVGWKTYTNSVDKYTIKYPSNWIVKEEEGQVSIQNKEGYVYSNNEGSSTPGGVNGSSVVITATYKKSTQSLNDYLTNDQFSGDNAEFTSVKINNYDGLKLTKLDALSGGLVREWMNNNDEVISLTLNVTESSEETSSKAIFDNMLSTFQLTN